MQDRYAGDVGDFVKLGLLRTLSEYDGSRGLRVGVNWYLTPDESHNADGKHVGYLSSRNERDRSLQRCDPELFHRLGTVVRSGDRSVSRLQNAGALPPHSIVHDERLRWKMSPEERAAWHMRALAKLADADVIFADPDNGVGLTVSRGSRSAKYALIDELRGYSDRGQSLVVYHHADRSPGGASAQVKRRLGELLDATKVKPLGAVISHRGSCRFFLIVPSPDHRPGISLAIARFHSAWQPHAEFTAFDWASAND